MAYNNNSETINSICCTNFHENCKINLILGRRNLFGCTSQELSDAKSLAQGCIGPSGCCSRDSRFCAQTADRRLWRELTNSDGANDGAADQRVAGERWQILASALTDWLPLGFEGQSTRSAPWGSGSVVLGPRPPTGVGESPPPRPGTSRRRSAVRGSRATSLSCPTRSSPGGDAGRTAEKAGDSRF